MNPLKSLFRRKRAPLVSPDPAPEYSAADRADGLPRRAPGSILTSSERLAVDARLEQLAAPLVATDTEFLRDAICDGDNPALRSEVFVTADGSLVHGDLAGGAA
jgi:hypothetical protein